MILALLFLGVACVRAPIGPQAVAPLHRTEIWVDGSSTPGGDGSRDRPLKRLPEVIDVDTDVHVRTGVYEGAFSLGRGVVIEGHGEVVLAGPADRATVTSDGATLVHVSVQGGSIGIAGTAVTLRTVHVSGQRKQAMALSESIALRDVEVIASVEGIDGLSAPRVDAQALTLRGGFRRGVHGAHAQVELRGFVAEGAKTPIHLVESVLSVKNGKLGGGSGPAVFLAAGSATLEQVDVRGQEYGLQITRGAVVTVKSMEVQRTTLQCVSVLGSTVTMEKVRLSACGFGGGIQSTDSTLTVTGLHLTHVDELGVLVQRGHVVMTDSSIDTVSGDGVNVREGEGRFVRLMVRDVQGTAMVVTAGAKVVLERLEVERAGLSALFVERGGELEADMILVRGGSGAALIVPDAAHAKIGSISVAGGREVPIYAECRVGAVVELERIESTVQLPPSVCVTNPVSRGGEGRGEGK